LYYTNTPNTTLYFIKDKRVILLMAKTQFDIPSELNDLLRIYVIENKLKSRENAILYILKNYLFEIYKLKRAEND